MELYLDKEKSPHIIINVLLLKYISVDCFLDTGFSGGLSLPKKYKKFLKNIKPISFLDYKLADGSLKTFEIYNIKVRFRNRVKLVSSFFTDGNDALIGIDFLMGFKFILDLKKFKISLD